MWVVAGQAGPGEAKGERGQSPRAPRETAAGRYVGSRKVSQCARFPRLSLLDQTSVWPVLERKLVVITVVRGCKTQ